MKNIILIINSILKPLNVIKDTESTFKYKIYIKAILNSLSQKVEICSSKERILIGRKKRNRYKDIISNLMSEKHKNDS